MLYIDSNIFIYAAVNTAEPGEKARCILQKIQHGEERAVTSALTFDEVFWSVKKYSEEAAMETCQALLDFPNLEMAAVTKETVRVALDMIKRYRVAPRDAIHAATASAEKADSIISTDPHFDKIKELRRKPL